MTAIENQIKILLSSMELWEEEYADGNLSEMELGLYFRLKNAIEFGVEKNDLRLIIRMCNARVGMMLTECSTYGLETMAELEKCFNIPAKVEVSEKIEVAEKKEDFSEVIKIADEKLEKAGFNTADFQEFWFKSNVSVWDEKRMYFTLNYGRTHKGSTKWTKKITMWIDLNDFSVNGGEHEGNASERSTLGTIVSECAEILKTPKSPKTKSHNL